MSDHSFSVSVLIPAFNESKSLPHVLHALKNQTVKALEIIVIDNNSTDDTSAVAKKHGAIVVFEKQKGTNNALETGRLIARGNIIARIDADCLPQSDWIEHALLHFKNPKVNAVTGPYDYYDGSKTFRNSSLLYQKYVYSTVNHGLKISRAGGILIGGNSIMRASDLKKIGGFDRNIIFYGEDTALAKKLSKIGWVIFDKKLIMKTSARRFHTEGVISIFFKYVFAFMKSTIKS